MLLIATLSEHNCSTCSVTVGSQFSAVSLTQDVLHSPNPDLVSGSSVPFTACLVAVFDQDGAFSTLLYRQQASDNLSHCRQQRSKEVGAAIMAKRRTNLLAYSLLTMQADAAKQANKKQQMHSAEQLHRLHVQLEAFAAWRAFTQVSCPCSGVAQQTCNVSQACGLTSLVLESSCILVVYTVTDLHLPYQSTVQMVTSCFACLALFGACASI